MQILIITASLPYPPASGGAIRTLGIIHGLYQAGHEITLLSFHTGITSPYETPLADYCTHIETVSSPTRRSVVDRLKTLFFSQEPDIARRFYDVNFAETLRQLLRENEYDLIQFEAIETICYLPVAQAEQPEAKLSFDTFNAEYALQRNMFEIDRTEMRRWPLAVYSFIQTRRITRYERQMCRAADIVFAVSEEDADLLRNFRDDRQIYVVPSGIFADDYTTPGMNDALTLEHPALVFTGTMDYRPNVDAMLWFTETVLPRIHASKPETQLYIVGNRPHSRLEHLRQQQNIHITGWVNATQPYLHAADLYIAPLRMGSGTRLKLLEAMAAGRAIISTSTAAAGLQDEAKSGMIIADDPAKMADTITKLIDDAERREAIGTKARELVRHHYDWSVLVPHLLTAYREIGLG